MAGYYKNPDATAAAIDPDGWLHTGDLGVIDAEGTIFIHGRSKTLILGPSGQNIYPEEIEAKLNSLPLVGESLVLERNGRLFALVYPDLERVARAEGWEITLSPRPPYGTTGWLTLEEELRLRSLPVPSYLT